MKKIDILDKGYVKLVETWGSDERIIEAARMSTGKGFNGWGTPEQPGDEKLLKYLYNNHHCYHEDMEVLTVAGWKKWKDCKDVENYIVPNPITKELTVETLQTLSFDVTNSPMCNFTNSRMSYCVTENHKMWFKKKQFRGVKVEPQFEKVDAIDMADWGHFEGITGYTYKHTRETTVEQLLKLQLIGFYLGDGTSYSKNIVGFHLTKDRKKKYLEDLLNGLCIEFSVKETNKGFFYKFTLPSWFSLYTNFGARGKDKQFTKNIFDFSISERKSILDGLCNSDGHKPKVSSKVDTVEFSSKSENIIETFMCLANSIGYECHFSKVAYNGVHRVKYHTNPRTSLEARKQYFSKTIYSGKVYCTTTSTGLLVVRGNPTDWAFICGNSTPFEMAGMIVEVRAPIFVFREWHRHRTQCLVGNTKITCVSPNNTTYKRTIKDIFELKYGKMDNSAPELHKNGVSKAGNPVKRKARRKDSQRTKILPNCQDRLLRVLDENTNEFYVSKMKDVWESGEKEVFSVKAGSYEVVASAEHPFFTKRGWVKTKELMVGDKIARMGVVPAIEPPIPPRLRQGIGIWTSRMRLRLIEDDTQCYVCENKFTQNELDLDHVIPVKDDLSKALDVNNLKPICKGCHRKKTNTEQSGRDGQTKRGVRWETVEVLPESRGIQMTYDIEVCGEHHNYCANDLVVHNSYNEASGRYIPLPNDNYTPSIMRIMDGAGADTTNKQAQGVSDNILTLDQAIEWQQKLDDLYKHAQEVYDEGLRIGVPKELARLPVPVSRYSSMRASCNLRNWLHFLSLRMDTAAQWEIREYANVVGKMIEQEFPRTWELFENNKH